MAVLLGKCCGSRSDPKLLTGTRYGSRKNHLGSGSGQLQLRNEFEVKLSGKLIKIGHLSTKMFNLKI
jgi:hypothetical protein